MIEDRLSAPTTDILGEPWQARTITVTESPDAPGSDRAVLVHQRDHATRDGGRPLPRAALFLPGFADTFFQTAHAQQWIDAGIEFYALECRAQGRAVTNPDAYERINDLTLRHEETSIAMRWLHSMHRHVTLIGHSTGGLQAAIYSADHPLNALDDADPDAVVLNSPWLALPVPEPARTIGGAAVQGLARFRPDAPFTELKGYYGKWLHRNWGGEWDFDTTLKAVEPLQVRAGTLAAVRRLQRRIERGLPLTQPTLLACSTRGGDGSRPDSPDLENTDVILNPDDMVRLAPKLGGNVTLLQIANGVHDLACSREPVRDYYTQAAITFALRN